MSAGARPLHEPFSWLESPEPSADADFAAVALNVCRGVETCLQMIHSTDLELHHRDWGNDDAKPILGRVDKERLMLLATAAVQMLGQQADARINAANEQAPKVRGMLDDVKGAA